MTCLSVGQFDGGPARRPGTPTDQAWIESFFGHPKAENPHLLAIEDPVLLRADLDSLRTKYNGGRLHSSIGYVTPNDEHEGRGQATPLPSIPAPSSTDQGTRPMSSERTFVQNLV